MIESIISFVLMIVCTAVVMYMLTKSSDVWDKITYGIALVICGIMILMTFSMCLVTKEYEDNEGHYVVSDITEYNVIEHASVEDGDTIDVTYDILYKYKK